MSLTYDVSYTDDGLSIEFTLPAEAGMGTIPAGDPMYEADALVFTLDVGDSVSCNLLFQDDGYFEGDCVDSSGEGALMTMFPPEDG